MYQRQLFQFTDTGTQTIVGPSFHGEILQYRWALASGDTGGSLEISHDIDQADTGQGWVIASHGLQPQLVKALRQPAHAGDGFDTGVDRYVPIVSAGGRLRVKRTNTAAGAVVGRLYVWAKS